MNLARTRITNLCEQCRRRDLRFYHQQSGSCTSGSSVDKLPVGAVKQSDAQLTCKHKKITTVNTWVSNGNFKGPRTTESYSLAYDSGVRSSRPVRFNNSSVTLHPSAKA